MIDLDWLLQESIKRNITIQELLDKIISLGIQTYKNIYEEQRIN